MSNDTALLLSVLVTLPCIDGMLALTDGLKLLLKDPVVAVLAVV